MDMRNVSESREGKLNIVYLFTYIFHLKLIILHFLSLYADQQFCKGMKYVCFQAFYDEFIVFSFHSWLPEIYD